MAYTPARISPDDQLARLLSSAAYPAWRQRVESVGGCLHPVHLTGSTEVRDVASGAVVSRRAGTVLAPCGTRREAVCPACSAVYAADAWHLVHAGLCGGKGVPTEVSSTRRAFITLTPPSFGRVHNRPGKRPCGCGRWHPEGHPLLGTPLDPAGYDYAGAVLWQAHVGQLWHRFRITLTRALAAAGGLTVREAGAHFRLAYARVAEYQRRGLIHLHVVARVDGPDGPGTTPPAWLTDDVIADAVVSAASAVSVGTVRPDGSPLTLTWGTQVDVRPIPASDTPAPGDTADGTLSDSALAGYIAKYATKGTGAVETGDRRLRSQQDIDYLRVSAHHRAMIQTAWNLGGMEAYAELNLRLWAHMLGFRGHFLTKSRAYSTTFSALRGERRAFNADRALEEIGMLPGDVAVINHWEFVRVGYRNSAERELAAAIGERKRLNRQLIREE